MVHAYHLIFGAYGFWLPNDPRGSWSVYVGSRDLYDAGGPATKTDERRSLAKRPHDRKSRLATKKALKYPPVRFDGLQARAIMRGINKYVTKNDVTIWAAAIMPDHAHFVVARHHYPIEKVAELLKQAATTGLNHEDRLPFRDQPRKSNGRPPGCWVRGHWSVYLDTEDDILRAIDYVNRNPTRDGFQKQHWSLVTPFSGLPTT